jgi:5-methyltetrahydropteroyltriglutamate--homocysteine methyltransferase
MTTLFPASVVGSMPRSAFVRDLVNGQPELPASRREAEMDAAIRYVVALQEHAGLDVVTDGEWRRKSYIGVIAELAQGFTLEHNPKDGRPWTVVTDPVVSSNPGFIAGELRFLKSITTRGTKITLPAPALLGERLWDAKRSCKAYPTREAFVGDCVPVLRREIELIVAAGADIIQIDDPHLCLFVDPQVRAGYDDPDRAADFAVDMINDLVAGFPGVRFAVHLCRRAGARVRGESDHSGGYGPIISQLNRLKVQHLTMEFATSGVGGMNVFRELRSDFEIGLGCVSVNPGEITSRDAVVHCVTCALDHLDAGRVTLNPDCGFAPGSGAVVDMDEVYQKLRIEAEAAARLRELFSK